MSLDSIFYGRVRRIHFVGIGGIGMSGIAEVLIGLGLEVHGSDIAESDTTRRLRELGARIHIGHNASNLDRADVVVVSTIVKEDNPEIQAALAGHIPVIKRAEMLAELMRLKHGIAIAGSHGKTTTTSLVAKILQIAGFDPTAVIGGKVNHIGSNARLGRGKFLVAEADESDGTFLLLSPSIAVITNIDPEHLDYWKGGLPELQDRFTDFANHLPFFGLLVACADAPNVRAILPQVKRRVVTYGIEHPADFSAKDIVHDGFSTKFCVVRDGRELGCVTIRLVGRHNVQNTLAAIAVANELGITFTQMKDALERFSGVQRRFSLVGEAKGVTIIDDYGHHPTEIKAVLDAAKVTFPDRRIIALFQPHRYSRTELLFEDFTKAFQQAKVVGVLDIYSAGEQNTFEISSQKLVDGIQATGHDAAHYLGTNDAAVDFALKNALPNDVIITLGAGNITHCAPKILKGLSEQTN